MSASRDPAAAEGRGHRDAPHDLAPEQFRALGHRLIDQLADFMAAMPNGKVTPGEAPAAVRAALGGDGLPEYGADADALLAEATRLVLEHSLFNGHPRFFGYITSSAAPLGALGDLLAASVNSNCGSFSLSPAATEIEKQTVRWIAELIGFPAGDGVLVSGGNMANFVGFLAGRRAKTGADVRSGGLGTRRVRVYASAETHTWVQKACDLFGLGTDALRWIPVDAALRMDVEALERTIETDRAAGDEPMMVIGTAGSVGTGAIDDLAAIAAICTKHALWFHVDGAYGGLAAALPEAPEALKALSLGDSVAVDPHKWLYAPLEAGCALVRDPQALLDTFSYRPSYYHFDNVGGEAPVNFYERGPQNSRGFRALKVWLGLRQAGRAGYLRMMGDDVRLSVRMYERVAKHPRLEPFTQGLSITTFRYVPEGVDRGDPAMRGALDTLNTELLTRLQERGDAYLSNAVIRGCYALRACIVNFRTTESDVDALPGMIAEIGDEIAAEMREAGTLVTTAER